MLFQQKKDAVTPRVNAMKGDNPGAGIWPPDSKLAGKNLYVYACKFSPSTPFRQDKANRNTKVWTSISKRRILKSALSISHKTCWGS